MCSYASDYNAHSPEVRPALRGEGAITIRQTTPADRAAWIRMRVALWPDGSAAEHDAEADRFFRGASSDTAAVFVAEDAHAGLVGFAEVSIRSYAEGCLTDRVGYLEGWYVAPGLRGRGIGRALVRAAERWAATQGCSEFASDAEADNQESSLAHRALGFAEVGLVRCFRKALSSEDEARLGRSHAVDPQRRTDWAAPSAGKRGTGP